MDFSFVVAVSSLLLALLAMATSVAVPGIMRQRRLTPVVTRTGVSIPAPDYNREPPLTYPLKCYVTLRNDASESADVRLSSYQPRDVTIKDFPLDVLQVRFGREWCPRPDGVDRVAVLPGQQFRAWIGLDERRFDAEKANDALIAGKVGTLVFLINGKPVSIELEV
jgi:hypothetical protein